MELTLFTIIDYLTIKKIRLDFRDDEVAKAYNPFFIDTALSKCDVLIDLVANVSSMNLCKRKHFDMYFSILPQRKFYLDWSDKYKPDTDKLEKVKYIADYYRCNNQRAFDYYHLLSKEQLEKILDIYRYGKTNKLRPLE